MADEQEAIAETELETPAIEPEVETETPEETEELPVTVGEETETEGGDEPDESEPTADEPEFVTLERNGKQYQVPKELEGEFLMQADYTRKRQADAEKAKELEQREQQLNQQFEASESEMEARATLKSVNAQLAEYAKLTPEDWNAHELQDPLGTRQHERLFQSLKAQKAELEGKVSTAQNERTEKAQQDLAKRVQKTLEAATTIIPGVTKETVGPAIDKLVNFAQSEGIPDQALRANWSPMLLGLLHKAHIGSLAIAKQSAPKPSPKPAVTPLATVKAKSSPSTPKSLADIAASDDMEAYAAARADGRRR